MAWLQKAAKKLRPVYVFQHFGVRGGKKLRPVYVFQHFGVRGGKKPELSAMSGFEMVKSKWLLLAMSQVEPKERCCHVPPRGGSGSILVQRLRQTPYVDDFPNRDMFSPTIQGTYDAVAALAYWACP